MYYCQVCGSNNCKLFVPKQVKNAREIVFGYKWSPETRKTLEMWRCLTCLHVQAVDIPKNLANSYVDVADELYLENSDLRRLTARSVIKVLRKHVKSGKLLDLGCGTGEFLEEASSSYDPYGIELSGWAADCAQQRFNFNGNANQQGIRIFRQEISLLNEYEFDLITMWGVIEHLENPNEVLREINKRLNSGGILAIWTGNSASIPAKILKSRWWYVIGQHVNLFSGKSLDHILTKHGFEKVRMRVYPYTMRLGYLGKSLGRYPLLKPLSIFTQLSLISSVKFKLLLPGEMFAIYRKV